MKPLVIALVLLVFLVGCTAVGPVDSLQRDGEGSASPLSSPISTSTGVGNTEASPSVSPYNESTDDKHSVYNCKKDSSCFSKHLETCTPARYVSDDEQEFGWENNEVVSVEFILDADCAITYKILKFTVSSEYSKKMDKPLENLVRNIEGKTARCLFPDYQKLKIYLIHFLPSIITDHAKECSGPLMDAFEEIEDYQRS